MSRVLVVLVGAGASHDCTDSPVVVQNWRPPLAAQLFSDKREYVDILVKYPGAAFLAPMIRAFGEEGFEENLRKYQSHPNPDIRRNFLHVPLYLQDLIWTFCQEYVLERPTRFDHMIGLMLDANFDHVLFLTLNYDLLLDAALQRALSTTFKEPGDWHNTGRGLTMVKLHGSVNWGYKFTINPGMRIVQYVKQNDLPPFDVGAIEVTPHLTRIHDAVHDLWYPALSVPIPGKTNYSCLPSAVAHAKSVIQNMTHLLCIGFSGKDDHVLDLLAESPNPARFAVVDYDSRPAGMSNRNAQRVWEHVKNRVSVKKPPSLGDETYICNEGFNGYVNRGFLARFLASSTG